MSQWCQLFVPRAVFIYPSLWFQAPKIEQLEKMPREELIALVLGLYADRKDMQAALEQLRMELEELRSQIKGTPPNSGNSSTPPSRDRKGNRGLDRQRGQRGAKPGHAVHTRPLINNPNKVIKAKVKTCAGCGEDLRKVEANAVIRRQVTELPKVARW